MWTTIEHSTDKQQEHSPQTGRAGQIVCVMKPWSSSEYLGNENIIIEQNVYYLSKKDGAANDCLRQKC